ncbi:hypothetical protein, partial [Staphylococcus warneri]|uniref:hypothetical protein n=1 Tax=Staphylococcus warneri TaxID=1292 RepID=UPI003BA2813E
MATPTGYGSNIRQSLVNKGVSSNDIGYNKATGYVTVKGKDFLKPSKVQNGVSYDTVSNFNKAWNSYQGTQKPVSVANTSRTTSSVTPGSVAIRSGLTNAG